MVNYDVVCGLECHRLRVLGSFGKSVIKLTLVRRDLHFYQMSLRVARESKYDIGLPGPFVCLAFHVTVLCEPP